MALEAPLAHFLQRLRGNNFLQGFYKRNTVYLTIIRVLKVKIPSKDNNNPLAEKMIYSTLAGNLERERERIFLYGRYGSENILKSDSTKPSRKRRLLSPGSLRKVFPRARWNTESELQGSEKPIPADPLTFKRSR